MWISVNSEMISEYLIKHVKIKKDLGDMSIPTIVFTCLAKCKAILPLPQPTSRIVSEGLRSRYLEIA